MTPLDLSLNAERREMGKLARNHEYHSRDDEVAFVRQSYLCSEEDLE